MLFLFYEYLNVKYFEELIFFLYDLGNNMNDFFFLFVDNILMFCFYFFYRYGNILLYNK